MNKNKKRGTASEKRAARKYGGRLTPGSGSKWFAKGDVSVNTPLFGYSGALIENKCGGKQHVLKRETLEKIRQEALSEDKLPIYRVEFDAEIGNLKAYIVLAESDWESIITYCKEQELKVSELLRKIGVARFNGEIPNSLDLEDD